MLRHLQTQWWCYLGLVHRSWDDHTGRESHQSECHRQIKINSLSSRGCGCDFKCLPYRHNHMINILKISTGIILRWIPQDHIDVKSTLDLVKAWCCQAMGPYLTNVDKDPCCHMVLLGHSDLNPCQLTEAEWHIHASVSYANVGSENGLLPRRRQAIIGTNVVILLIGPLVTNFCKILIEIYIFSSKKMHLKLLSAKCQPFCLGFNVLTSECVCSWLFDGQNTWWL